ncbi:MAG: alanine racemase [Oscillospiraceae bacterium]|nr:alanine racemase [Oscillospiraceae bacterium]
MHSPLKRTWAEIDLDNLAHNFARIRAQVGETPKLLGVVKADAYGHGAVKVARKLEQLGAGYLAVSNIDEAAELRDGGVTLPILMLGFTPADQAERAVHIQMTQAVPNLEIARAYDDAAARAGTPLRVHIKLDTGMGRLGFPCDDAHFEASLRDIRAVLALPHLDVEGVFTHFAVSDEDAPDDVAFTHLQHERFLRMIDAVERDGFRFRLKHCCNAGGIASYPEWAADMVRCGIILYGTGDLAERMGMRPVMRLKTTVATVRDFDADTPISYGRTYYTGGAARIAVLSIGYADGLHRALSNKLQVKTPYGMARQVGRICMDMCMIDATEQPQLRPGDEVEIFGDSIPCEALAKACGTISYELLCAVSKRVPRIYYESK